MAGRHRIDKGKTAARIVAWYAEGLGPTRIVEELRKQRIHVTRQAVQGFRRRHAIEIAALTQQAVALVEDAAITDKADRIRRRQYYVDQLEAVMRERGPMATDVKWIGGFDGYEVKVERVDTALYRTASELLNDVARELGEIPKAGDAQEQAIQWTQINIDNRQVHVRTDGRSRRIIPSDPE